MKDWRSVSIPRRMRALQRDSRGYPVPFTVLRGIDNKPHFTTNDQARQQQCLAENRCQICGAKLDKVFWFLGGPGSAFHPHGYYMDTAMHHDCMTYALQVCPYLAAPRYLNRLDDKTIDYEKLAPENRILVDVTQDPDRPTVFVAVGAVKQELGRHFPLQPQYVRPVRPYEAIEYWRHGEKLTQEQGIAIVSRDADPVVLAELKRMTAPPVTVAVLANGREFRVVANRLTAEVLRRSRKTLRTAEGADHVCFRPNCDSNCQSARSRRPEDPQRRRVATAHD